MSGMAKKQTQAACTLYHNPRCSKSRATLALLQSHGIEPKVIEYLRTPPTSSELRRLLTLLAMKPMDLLRTGENEYETLIAGQGLTDAQLISVMTDNPILIERPIVVMGDRAAIGRPPENVLSLLKVNASK